MARRRGGYDLLTLIFRVLHEVHRCLFGMPTIFAVAFVSRNSTVIGKKQREDREPRRSRDTQTVGEGRVGEPVGWWVGGLVGGLRG